MTTKPALEAELEVVGYLRIERFRAERFGSAIILAHIVAAGLAKKCEIQIAYAIGVAEPVSVMVDLMGTGVVPKSRVEEIVKEVFDLRPAAIIEYLDLLRPIYRLTSAYGHFGRNEDEFSWEKTNKADIIREKAGL